MRRRLWIIFLLVACVPRVEHPKEHGAFISALYRPEGEGPFPAVVILHGCYGVTAAEVRWAKELRARGYVALLLDSFGPRGVGEICTDFTQVPREARIKDAYDARDWLIAQPYVDAAHIGILGLSNGGYTLLGAIGRSLSATGTFQAAVAIYPECLFDQREDFLAPLLILIGGADDWTLASSCQKLASYAAQRPGLGVSLRVYPGAYHAFDSPGLSYTYYATALNPNKPGGCCGATMAYDRRAHKDAIEQVARFFEQHLIKPGSHLPEE